MNKIGIRILLCGVGMLLVALLSGCSAGPNLTFSSARPIDRSEQIDCPSDSSTGCTATVGTAFTGILVSGDSSDWIEVTLTELTIYKIELTVGSQELTLQNEAGMGVTIDDDKQFTAQAGGTYFVVISGSEGEYSLLISSIRTILDPIRVTLAEESITITVDASELEDTETTVWWAVYADNTVPTIDQVKAGTNTVAGAFNGSAGTPLGTLEDGRYTIRGTISPALTVDAAYDVYIVVGDGTTDRLLDKEDATAVDDLAPTFGIVTAAPKAGESGPAQVITITIPNLSETAKIFWQIVITSAPAPDVSGVVTVGGSLDIDVTNGSAAGSVPGVTTAIAAAGIETPPITLVEGTTYHVYVVAQDSAGQNSVLSDRVILEIPAASLPTKPTVSGSITATLSAATGNNLDITGLGSPAGTGTIYWGVYADMTTPAPSATAIQVGSGALNNAARGSIPFSAAGSGITTGVPGITAGTKYEVYVVYTAENSAGTTDSDVILVGGGALKASAVDTIKPNIGSASEADYSDDNDRTPDEQRLTITLKGVTEAGRVYWVIVANGVPQDLDDVVAAGGGARDIDYDSGNQAAGNEAIATGDQMIVIDDIKIADGSDTRVYVVLEDGAINRRLLPVIDPGPADADAPDAPTLSAAGGSLTDATIGNLGITGLTHASLTTAGRVHWAVFADAQSGIGVAGVKDPTGQLARGDVLYSSVSGSGTVAIDVGGISAGTEYHVYIALTNGAGGNTTDAAAPIYVTNGGIRARDVILPDGSFTAVDGTNAGDILITLTNDGTSAEAITTAKYVIVLGGALVSGNDYTTLDGKTVAGSPSAGDVVALGDFTVPIVASANQVETATLSASTQYTVYVLIADNAATPNGVVLAPKTITTKALADPAPTFGTVTAVAIGDTALQTFTFTIADLSENATIHWAVLADGSDAPVSAADLKALVAGTPASTIAAGDSGSAITAGASVMYTTPEIPVVGGTDYDLYIVATDNAGKDSAVLLKIEATANDDPVPTTGTVTARPVGLRFQQMFEFTIAELSEDATIHWAVLADGAPAPVSAMALKELAEQTTIPAAGDSGSAITAGAGVIYTTPEIFVEINTAYDLYIVATDNGNQDSAVSSAINVTSNGTMAVVPTIVVARSQTGSPTATGFTVEYDLGGAGVTGADVYWAVQLAGAADIANDAAGFTAVRTATVTGAIVAAGNERGTAVGTDKMIVITGLPKVLAVNVDTTGTYEVFIVAETATGGRSDVAKIESVAITPSASPAFTAGPTATASSSKGGQIDLTYAAESAEQVSYVVLAAATDAPTDYATLVAATGVGTNGEAEDVDGTGSAVSIAVTGLAADDYAVYWVIRTGSFESLIIRTPDTGNIAVRGKPSATIMTDGVMLAADSITISLTGVDEDLVAHWAIYPSDTSGGAEPDIAGVKAGTGGALNSGAAKGMMNVTSSSMTVTASPIPGDPIPVGIYDIYVVLTRGVSTDAVDNSLLPAVDNVPVKHPEPTLGTATATLTDFFRDNLVISGLTDPSLATVGRVHWAVYADAQAGITAADVRDGANSPVATGDNPYSDIETGSLTVRAVSIMEEANYYVYIALTNGAGVTATNGTAVITANNGVTTATDGRPPVFRIFNDATPNGAGASQSFTVPIRFLDENATIHWVVLEDNTMGPADAAALKALVAGTPASTIATGASAILADMPSGRILYTTMAITVASETDYDLYIVATDAAGNESSVSPKIEATSNGATDPPPTFAPSTQKVTVAAHGTGTSQSFTFSIPRLSEPAAIHWVVLADGTTAPGNAAALKALVAGTPASTIAIGESAILANILGGFTLYTTPLITVESATDYDLYIVATDSGGNDSDVSAKIEVTSNIDTPPQPTADFGTVTLTAGTGTAGGLDDGISIELTNITGSPDTVYWRVYPMSASPTIADVKGGGGAIAFRHAGSVGRDNGIKDRMVGSTTYTVRPVSGVSTGPNLETSTTYTVYVVLTDLIGDEDNPDDDLLDDDVDSELLMINVTTP